MAVASPIRPTAPSIGLRSQRSSHRLNQIEKIRANGIGDLVDLPQLVVCGDQSAGKSSVLEGITGIPFPRQEGLCTRFPTEIILRHSNTPLKTTATIRPHASRSADVSQKLRAYQREMKEDLSDLPAAIEEVSKLMGIRGFSNSDKDSAFASDALRIEVTGPTGLQLSIVDLPGLISVANEEQSEADVEAVHAMVESYLSSTRTIILAVVQAGNDIANQGIIKIARKHDPDGQRTVGIITKPDLINVGTEAKLANIAKNNDSIKLKLGFFLLKNPSPAEMKAGGGPAARTQREMDFFSSGAWKAQNLDPSRVGIDNLKSYLQDLLDTHLEKELPKVREEIRRVLTNTEDDLKAMGPERRSLTDIRSFMTGLSMRYYQLSQAALDGNYHSSDVQFFAKEGGTRLRAVVHQENGLFAAKMRERGHKRQVDSEGSSESSDDASDGSSTPLLVDKDEMISWIRETYVDTRGRELPGNYNHVLLAELFHEQSSPWRDIAEQHVSTVVERVSRWVRQAVTRLVPEERLRRDIDSMCQEKLEESRAKAFEELGKIMADEGQHPITYNHYYTDNIQQARDDAQKSALRGAIDSTLYSGLTSKSQLGQLIGDGNMAGFLDCLKPQLCVDMDQQACEEALAGLNAYYKVAMKTFVDNVCRQVVERHILSPLPQIFYPSTVSQLSDDELVRIGTEPEREVARRQRLKTSAKGLRTSLVDLQSGSG
ncbi:Interferon-induced GTP-binding protein Mx1 [Colletotrichum spinosum]|uniref:Interferon-induced GTP-binding protein Mx1 n=1 Tax=Colletotrichum spinosum TaxID=1347390 RepID=A0A4R8QA87_9PEZI|nr:Interferon-induced GTP-binding protein Mx1 [Colletotrichum spinosum]